MTFQKKPALFEDLDDALFETLPAYYRLLESSEGFEMEVAECDVYRATMAVDPFYRPITKTLTPPEKGGAE